MASPTPLYLAVLLSGTGRSLANLLRVIADGTLQARISVVISSKPDVRGLDVAAEAGIPTAVIERREFPDDAYSEAVYAVLAPFQPDLIVMAGFLRKLIVRPEWEGRILNIHPALLPESAAAGKGFYGERVHAAVIASGARESGASVHVVDNGYDTGPVVMRATVQVLPGDTPASLGARVFAAECALYPEAIRPTPQRTGPDRRGGTTIRWLTRPHRPDPQAGSTPAPLIDRVVAAHAFRQELYRLGHCPVRTLVVREPHRVPGNSTQGSATITCSRVESPHRWKQSGSRNELRIR